MLRYVMGGNVRHGGVRFGWKRIGSYGKLCYVTLRPCKER